MSEASHETTETTTEHQRDGSELMKWLSGLTSLFGLWIALSPFVYEAAQATRWSNLITGLGITLLAGYNFYRLMKNHPTSVGAMSLVSLLGLWALISPAILDMADDGLMWSNVISGLASAGLGAYVAYASRKLRRGTAAGTR